MANLLEQSYSKHNMKMAMLNHEQTFRHQVYELHRLYRIQKVLMKNIREKNRGKTEEEEEEEGEEEGDFIEESEIELTLGPSNYNNQIGGRTRTRTRRMKKFGEGNSDSGMSFSASSSSTNGSVQKIKQFYRDNGEFVNGSQMGFLGFLDVQDDIKVSHHHPNPWLYQTVSLNLT
ncbi:hypothetical protein IC582_024931 [Cucumis melo]|uniref:Uncharacterized protein LOC103497380 n=1 Tax=Cucumis melo TaxID=3656 RepID=A0A1S3C5U9_CUCME|nr:uncharacterized protein LOC103497380 [Cucumis melo]